MGKTMVKPMGKPMGFSAWFKACFGRKGLDFVKSPCFLAKMFTKNHQFIEKTWFETCGKTLENPNREPPIYEY